MQEEHVVKQYLVVRANFDIRLVTERSKKGNPR